MTDAAATTDGAATGGGRISVLENARRAMAAAPGDTLARLAYYEALADSELVLWIELEPSVDGLVSPVVFDTSDGRFALAFETDDRLSGFAGRAVPYAALPGRALVAMLAGAGVGLGVNLDDAKARFLMSAEAVEWLARTLAEAPRVADARPDTLSPPDLPDEVLAALDRKLRRAAGLAAGALLVRAGWPDGRTGHLLAFLDAAPGVENVLARAVGDALTFSGHDAGEIDILHLAGSAPIVERIEPHALHLEIPRPPEPESRPEPEPGIAWPGLAPGADPSRPPWLR